MMRVKGLDWQGFETACRRLERMVEESGYEYDTLVGIARGGDYVAANFSRGVRFSVSARRPGTRAKEGELIRRAIGMMPEWLADLLRIVESEIGELRSKFKRKEIRQVCIDENLLRRMSAGDRKVLIVDDAADSGLTLRLVAEALKAAGGDHEPEIRTAVIAMTRKNCNPAPDYRISEPGTLIRFPWAPDS